MYFILCPRQGLKIDDGVLHRVYILGLFCPKQGQGLKPSAAPLYPTIGQVPPPGVLPLKYRETFLKKETEGVWEQCKETGSLAAHVSQRQHKCSQLMSVICVLHLLQRAV